MRSLAPALFALALGSSPAAALTTVIYDNYGLGENNAGAIIGQFNGKDFQNAYPFVVPTGGGDIPLESITLRLSHSNDPQFQKGDFTLRLREDDAGLPGPVVESWTINNVFTQKTDVLFPSVSHPVLLEGQTYWVNLKVEAGTGLGFWAAVLPTSTDFVYAETGALDPTWLVPANPFLVGLMRIVPEPGEPWMIGAGAALLVPLALRRRRPGRP